MGFWDFIAKWGWPVLWLVFALTLFDAWHDHRELSKRILFSEGEEKRHSIRRRVLKWMIPVLALLGAVIAQVDSDLNEKKINDLDSKTAPRTLSVEQQIAIQKELQGSSASVYFVINDSIPDAVLYAESIRQLLQKCGYGVIPTAGTITPTQFDVTIEPNDSPDAAKLKDAFRAARVTVHDGPGNSGGFGNIKPVPEGTVTITVGAKGPFN